MGGVNDRSRPTKPFDSQRLAKITEEAHSLANTSAEDEELERLQEWAADPEPRRTAAGTAPPKQVPAGVQKQEPQAAAKSPEPAKLPPAIEKRTRTSTVHDPLTTSLLAEVARRTQTIDMAPLEDEPAVEAALDTEEEASAPTRNRR